MDQQSENMSGATWMLGGLALGAAIMFMTDPERGRRRRAMAAEKLQSAMDTTTDYLGTTARDLGSRVQDMSEQARDMLPSDTSAFTSSKFTTPSYQRAANAGTSSLWMIGSAALGALAMYLADPELGSRRRAMASDKFRSASDSTRQYVADTSRDLSNKTAGLMAEARRMVPGMTSSSTDTM